MILRWKESLDIVLEAPEPADPSDDFALNSVPFQLEQRTWVALIENRRTGEVHKVQVGDQIENFIVKEIDAGRVVLGDETGQEIILTPPFIISEPPFALILTGTIEMKEQKEKAWIAQIENRITGETYFKREGEQIEDIFTVGEIERNKLIILEEGKEDRVLKLGQTGD